MTTLSFPHRFAFVLAALCLSFATPAFAESDNFKIENPDRRLWRTNEDGSVFGNNVMYRCFHSVCPPTTSVLITEAKGPEKRPSKSELQTIATRDLPTALAKANKDATPGKITQTAIQGWPALRGKYVLSSGERKIGIAFAQIHMDGTVILMRAASGDVPYAPRALDAFLETLTLRAP